MKNNIYFDNAATTPVDLRVLRFMMPLFRDRFGNPSSLHSMGQESAKAVEWARKKVADFLSCQEKEIIFTSGATESDNIAIIGLAKSKGLQKGRHIITSSIEHPAVMEACDALAKEGFKVLKLPVDKWGLVRLSDLKKAIRRDTFLVSIMYVNNEIGIIEPISKIGSYLTELNKTRLAKKLPKIFFHTDAVQAANLLSCKVDKLKVDLLSLSGHKMYGPKGVGVLFVRSGTPIGPIQYGGHHESGIRPGTINAPLISGMGKAIELVSKKQKNDRKKLKKLSERIIRYILKNIPNSRLNGHPSLRAESHINFTFDNVEGESLLLMLDMKGIAVSTGSACASGSLKPSHVLRATGLPDEKCHGSIRISLGRENTLDDVKYLLKILPGLVKKIRERSPF